MSSHFPIKNGGDLVSPSSRNPRFGGTPILRPIEECPSLRGLTFEEKHAIAALLRMPKAGPVFRASQHGFLHGVDCCPQGCFAVALMDRTHRTIEIQVLAGRPIFHEAGRSVWRVVYGDIAWPIGCDSLPLFAHDDGSEIYLVHGVRDFIAAHALYSLRSKRVFAMPVGSCIPAEALKAFARRRVWVPTYRDRAAAVLRETWRQQLHPLGCMFLAISLRDQRFRNGILAKNLADLLAIYGERYAKQRR